MRRSVRALAFALCAVYRRYAATAERSGNRRGDAQTPPKTAPALHDDPTIGASTIRRLRCHVCVSVSVADRIATRAVSRAKMFSLPVGRRCRLSHTRGASSATCRRRRSRDGIATNSKRSRARCDAHRYRHRPMSSSLRYVTRSRSPQQEAMRRSSSLRRDNPTYTSMQRAERYHRSAGRAVRSILHAISSRQEANANDFMQCAADLVLRATDPIPSDPLARSSSALEAPVRERAIRALREGEAREDVWFVTTPHEYQRYLHQLIAFEINTFEAVSRHIAEFSSMPWEFHWDMACQIRDELSHLEMWLERSHMRTVTLGLDPLSTHEFAVCRGHGLLGRLALLERLIEASALDALVLSRCFWEMRHDRVMVGYIDRVQSDEICHVRQGNKWLRRLCRDDEQILSLVEKIRGGVS